MKRLMHIVALCLFAALPSAGWSADCYADYKAKKDDPLRLHYGVVELSGACTVAGARAELADRLARRGWTLLNVLTVFGPEGLPERKADAGANYLRY